METVYPTPEQPNTRMRLLREDDAPTYSAAPKRKHVTMTDDEIVDSVCATCGMAAAGLYWQMERLVNKDGEWQISVSELADKFNTDVRRIQESMAKLVDRGWVVRLEQQNRFGISVKNVWRLPHHGQNVNVQGASGGAGSARLGVRANPLQAAPLNVDTVDTVDKRNNPSIPPQYPDDFLAFWKAYPNKTKKGDALKAWQSTKGIRPSLEELIVSVKRSAASSQWTRDEGQYIPHPATWLRAHSWEDSGVDLSVVDPLSARPPDCIHTYRDLIRMSDEGQYLPERYKEFVRAYKASH